MHDERVAHLRKMIGMLATEVELDSFRRQLRLQDEATGVMVHHIEVRRREILRAKGVRHA